MLRKLDRFIIANILNNEIKELRDTVDPKAPYLSKIGAWKAIESLEGIIKRLKEEAVS